MYTSRGKANDRFGCEMSGNFRVPYKCGRLAVIAGLCVLGAVAVLLMISLITFIDITANTEKEIVTYWFNEFYGSGNDDGVSPVSSLFRSAATVQGLGLGALLLVVLIILFRMLVSKLCMGRACRYSSDAEKFTVTDPKNGRQTVIPYSEVIGISWTERHSLFSPLCCWVTITGKTRDYGFTAIIPKSAQGCGIIETPFNIIREQTGLAGKDELYTLNRGINSKR